jgi:hypothetical protein
MPKINLPTKSAPLSAPLRKLIDADKFPLAPD